MARWRGSHARRPTLKVSGSGEDARPSHRRPERSPGQPEREMTRLVGKGRAERRNGARGLVRFGPQPLRHQGLKLVQTGRAVARRRPSGRSLDRLRREQVVSRRVVSRRGLLRSAKPRRAVSRELQSSGMKSRLAAARAEVWRTAASQPPLSRTAAPRRGVSSSMALPGPPPWRASSRQASWQPASSRGLRRGGLRRGGLRRGRLRGSRLCR